MMERVGILAYSSLIDHPGEEIAGATAHTLTDGIVTPFRVEFARTSRGRKGAPTLVPVEIGGAQVPARIFVLNVAEEEAANRLYPREINAVGSELTYRPRANHGPNDVVVERSQAFPAVGIVLYIRIGANIIDTPAELLAELAIERAKQLDDGRDGISYLIDAKRNGIKTPLSDPYEREIVRMTYAKSLEEALNVIRSQTPNR